MQHYPTDFTLTGYNVPVSMDQLINYVHRELDKYDNLVGMTNNTPQYSPYKNPIIFTTEDGRQVQIPEEIHREGIRLWTEYKSQQQNLSNKPINNSSFEQNPLETDDYALAKKQYEELQESPYSNVNSQQLGQIDPVEQEVEDINGDNNFGQNGLHISHEKENAPVQPSLPHKRSDYTFLYLIAIIACILIIYYFYKKGKFADMYATTIRA